MPLNATVATVTARIVARSRDSRSKYLALIDRQRDKGVARARISCGNLAHGFAAAETDKVAIRTGAAINIGIVTAFNDMLSAHQPYGRYPEQIKLFAREVGATAQVAGGVPAMCDGVTQGQDGMELSLFSRDIIALSTAVALSHGMFEGVALLGICDKIVPGLLIGALRFGHLPAVFVPAGPMSSGLPNKEKARIRQLHARGAASSEQLMDAEAQSYHGPGTCTFYGTANSNQMLLEAMGLHIPGAAFVHPRDPLRAALTRAAIHRVAAMAQDPNSDRPLGRCVDEKAIVNAIIALLATGGSTNHAIHLPAIARAAGIHINWDDFDELSSVVPLIARVYPNGEADVNAFHTAGGATFVIAALLEGGLLHPDIKSIDASGFRAYATAPDLADETLAWRDVPSTSPDENVLRPVTSPFQQNGGLKLVQGNLGRAVFKTSAVDQARHTIEGEAAVFEDQLEVLAAFNAGTLSRDVVIVVRFQGPTANGMPELHKLSPVLGLLQDQGHRVALITDGRMSGASGKFPTAIHVTPEAALGGPLAKLRDGDRIILCASRGKLEVDVHDAEWAVRNATPRPAAQSGTGRELFGFMRQVTGSAESGASAMLEGLNSA